MVGTKSEGSKKVGRQLNRIVGKLVDKKVDV